MEDTTARRLLREARVARLATVGERGRPHAVPICFVLDGDTIFTAVDAKPKSTVALRRLDNITANPQVAVLADHYDDTDWSSLWWVRVDGTAAVLAPADPLRQRAISLLQAKYTQYRDTPPPGPVIAVEIGRCSAWSARPVL